MRSLLLTSFVVLSTRVFAFDATIPVLHLPDYYNEEKREVFLECLENAMHNVGFFALTGTGVDPDLLDRAYDTAKQFFSLESEIKMQCQGLNGQRGYVPGESAKGEGRVDCKEFCHIGRELSDEEYLEWGIAKNIWPEEPLAFRPDMVDLYIALDSCKDAIEEVFSEVLGEEKLFLHEKTNRGDCLMRAIHYPKNPPEDAIWAGAHTDIDLFTILPRSTAKGLQVLNSEGIWIDVLVPDGAFIINCGDMLENLSNGYYKSAWHRVVSESIDEERFSLVFFVHPHSFASLDPLDVLIAKTGGERRYAKINRLELLAERLIDLGLASKGLKQFFIDSGAIERLEEVGRFSEKAKAILIQEGFLKGEDL